MWQWSATRSALTAFSRRGRAVALLACLPAAPAALADAFPDTLFFNGFEPCVGVQCAQVVCPAGQTTSVSGTVYMPNGTLPLPNVQVYVPSVTPGALVDGPAYDRCGVAPLGHPVAAALTDADGNFTLTNVPATTNVPLVLLAGKWRRQITIPNVPQCVNTPVATSDSRLPRTHAEGDIPLTAIATGSADSLECLLRKSGVADAEFSTSAGSGRFQLFAGLGGTNKFVPALGGASFADATTLWSTLPELSAYDQVMLACEGAQNPDAKPQTAINAMKAYADAGGRVYLAHWQNIWIGGENNNPSHTGAWPAVATWNFSALNLGAGDVGQVSNAFAQAANLYSWLELVGASPSPGTLPISGGKQTAIAIDTNVARSWVYLDTTSNNLPSVQYFSLTTPTEANASLQQGRVLFTDLHASSGDLSSTAVPFPSGCGTSTLSPQDKALLYAAFDLQRCVGSTKE